MTIYIIEIIGDINISNFLDDLDLKFSGDSRKIYDFNRNPSRIQKISISYSSNFSFIFYKIYLSSTC